MSTCRPDPAGLHCRPKGEGAENGMFIHFCLSSRNGDFDSQVAEIAPDMNSGRSGRWASCMVGARGRGGITLLQLVKLLAGLFQLQVLETFLVDDAAAADEIVQQPVFL